MKTKRFGLSKEFIKYMQLSLNLKVNKLIYLQNYKKFQVDLDKEDILKTLDKTTIREKL